MFKYSCICLAIIILIGLTSCKEVVYVYDEDGSHLIEDTNITYHNGTEAFTYTVSMSEEGTSKYNKIKSTPDDIKEDITKKINKLNDPVRKKGSILTGNLPGDKRIDQICSIYEYVAPNWGYKADWKGLEYFQYSNESLENGQEANKSGQGDCDDFSILLAALIESVGGTPRIIFAYGPLGGHAYAQVYLGQDTGSNSKVSRMIEWLKSNYKNKDIYAVKDDETDDVWLNLDWWKDSKANEDEVEYYPGGPLFNANDYILAYSDDRVNWTSLNPVPLPPIAKFSISKANGEGNSIFSARENITFDASESRDPDTKIKSWKWDYGDGKNGTGKIVSHAYSRGAKYNVTLTVIDSDDRDNKKNQSTKTIDINGLPIPIINYEPKDPMLGGYVKFDASQSMDPDQGGSIKDYKWDFGDGVKPSWSWPHPDPHKYLANGTYTVNLTVEDDKGATNTSSAEIKINLPPEAIIAIESPQTKDQIYNCGDEIKFNASNSIDRDGNIKEWQWDFGDSRNSSGMQVSHIYDSWGDIPVTLNVTDDNNASNKTKTILKINARPIASFTIDPLNPDEGEEVYFNASSSKDPNGRINRYFWALGECEKGAPEAWYATCTYRKSGEHSITLTVTDDLDVQNSTTVILRVSPPGIEKLMKEGLAFIDNGDYEKAIVRFSYILQRDGRNNTTNETVWYGKGFCHNKLREYEKARESLNNCLEINPQNAGALNEMANALAGLGRYEEALSASDKAILLNPDKWFIWADRGALLSRMNEFTKSADAYNKALLLNPDEGERAKIESERDAALAKIPNYVEASQPAKGRVANLGIPEFSWNHTNFDGFYYDIDNDLGSEQITFRLSDIDAEKKKAFLSDQPDSNGQMGVEYFTRAQSKDFKFKSWGQYEVIGFLGEKYIAAYDPTITESMQLSGESVPYLYSQSTDKNFMSNKQIIMVLIDDDSEMTINPGTPLQLDEGYELAIKSIDTDGSKVYLELTKDGAVVDSKAIYPSKNDASMADKTYCYIAGRLGDNMGVVQIAVHFKNSFRGSESSLATVDGIWQVSSQPMDIKEHTEYDKMSIKLTDAAQMTIAMDNKDNGITLSKGKDIALMQNIHIKIADQDATANVPLRYSIYRDCGYEDAYERRGSVANLGEEQFSWTNSTFPGFYYDMDSNTGTEQMTLRLSNIDSKRMQAVLRDQPGPDGKMGVEYFTRAQTRDFEFKPWGQYNVIGFLGEKYIAAYDSAITQSMKDSDESNPYLYELSENKNFMTRKNINRILIDDNSEMTISTDTPLQLEEGYSLVIKSIDIDKNSVYLDLSKDGVIVDSKVIYPSKDGAKMADKTYYKKGIHEVAQIAVHFKNAFSDSNSNLATVDGIWQISAQSTDIEESTEYDKMSIKQIDDNQMTIAMDNKDNQITLTKNRDITLMQNIGIKTADQDATESNPLRYCIYKAQTANQ